MNKYALHIALYLGIMGVIAFMAAFLANNNIIIESVQNPKEFIFNVVQPICITAALSVSTITALLHLKNLNNKK